MIYLQLFWEFFKTGLFAVGGGMATVPFLFDIGARTGWFTTGELANMIAVSESTPGPIGINMATYVGTHSAGYFGGLVATLGEITPSIVVILIVASILSKITEKPVVRTVFKVLKAAVVGLICYAIWQVGTLTFIEDSKIVWIPVIGFVVILTLMQTYKKVHPVLWIVLGAVFGIVLL
ncbi:MAG: chromate transporter [Sphaerochaetaceae bacterium]|nr:chromate transporter [Sphaerochaetaceae bacterium]